MPLAIGAVLGKLIPTTTKSKVFVVGGIVLLVFIIWAGMKWDAMKILGLEKDNQRLEIERDSAQESAEQADALRTIDEDVVRDTLDLSDAIDRDTEAVREQVRNDVRNIQRELEELQAKRQDELDKLAEVERQQLERETALQAREDTEADQGDEAPPVRVVERTVEVPVPAVDPRIAERIVAGLWDNYCGQVPDDRRCATRRPDAEDADGATAERD